MSTPPAELMGADGADVRVTATGPGAVAVGRMPVAGDVVHGDKNVYKLGKPKVSWPVRVGHVPDVAAQFQHRPGVDLAGRFAAADQVGTVTLVSAGLGGTGKTQLAAHYARSMVDLDLRVWVTAASRAGVVTAYAAAAVAVGVAAASSGDEQAAAEAFLSWLERTKKSWLVVLDDLVDPADLDGWWPTGRSGQVVVTTRRRDAELADHGGMVDIDVFDFEEAKAYLMARLAAWQCDDIAGVAADLGLLPLALAQAASYMLHRGGGGLRCSQYRARLADQAARLDVVLPSDARAVGYRSHDTARATVATTWSLSIEAANALLPPGAAWAVLAVASLLDANGIPIELFTTASAIQAGHQLTGDERRFSGDDLMDALDHLSRFSLADLNTDSAGQRWVRVHALVQRVARESVTHETINSVAWTVADGLHGLWPKEDHRVDGAGYLVRLRGNVTALERVARPGLFRQEADGLHPVLFVAANSLRAQPHQALDQARALALQCEQLLGPEHPDTLTSRNNLACAYQAAGRLAEAIPLFEATLSDHERLLGQYHPETLISRNNLAAAYRNTGQLAEAIPLFEAVLADRERRLEPDDTDTLTSRNNLGYAFLAAGRLAEALPLLEVVLADAERLFGSDHPNTLSSRTNLALAYRGAGRFAEALRLFEAIRIDRERLLGPDHPDTLISRINLAGAYLDVGRSSVALPLVEAALAGFERLLGTEHSHTLNGRNSLAYTYQAAGRLSEAIPLFEATLADRERLLGLNHPDVLTSRSNLASAYQAAGRLSEAIPLFEATLADRERLLDLNHPSTLADRNNLALAYLDAGRFAEAIPIFEAVVSDNERVLGPDHRSTLTSKNNLAHAYRDAGRNPG